MNQTSPIINEAKETLVVGSIRLIESPFKVKTPIFEDEVIKRPIFVDHEVKIPVGYDKVVNELALEISKALLSITLDGINKQLKMLEDKIAALSNIKTEERVILREIPYEVQKPVFVETEVKVERPVYIDREIINPVLCDTDIINAIIIDKAVTNCVVTDIRVTNAIIKDVEVERAVIREKIVEVIHKQCLDSQGNPL